MDGTISIFEKIYSQLLPFFDEKQRRVFLGSLASALGHGGVVAVSQMSGVSRQTVTTGKKELSSLEKNDGSGDVVPVEHNRTRREGGGARV